MISCGTFKSGYFGLYFIKNRLYLSEQGQFCYWKFDYKSVLPIVTSSQSLWRNVQLLLVCRSITCTMNEYINELRSKPSFFKAFIHLCKFFCMQVVQVPHSFFPPRATGEDSPLFLTQHSFTREIYSRSIVKTVHKRLLTNLLICSA